MKLRIITTAALLLLVPLAAAQELPDDAADLPISHLLSLATSALSAGKSHSALNIYDHVLARDPSDFSTLYKRATIRLATGQWAKAKDGFREVLELREFDMAHLELARLHAKLAEYDEAMGELEKYIALNQGGKDVEDARALKSSIAEAQRAYEIAEAALAAVPPRPDECLSAATVAIGVSPNSLSLRLLRADCYLLSSSFPSAIGDLSRASVLSPSLPPHLLIRLSLLSALFLDSADTGLAIPSDSLAAVKRCLNADPDNKACRGAFKALKNVEKDLAKLRNWVDAGKWMEAGVILSGGSTSDGVIKTIRNLITTHQSSSTPAPLPPFDNLAAESPLLTSLLSTLCQAYVTLGNARKSAVVCADVLAVDPENLWGRLSKADGLMAKEEWQEAVNILSEAFEATGRSNRMILDKLQKAQRLLKQSKAKDYYKVLGVTRDADARTIKKAYRKGTLKSHPDKEGGSEAKMANLNEAYEVLSNPELRARFDNGDDPNDPAGGQQGGHAHPFFQQGGGQQFFQQAFHQGGGNPFGGGGGGFNFKFG